MTRPLGPQLRLEDPARVRWLLSALRRAETATDYAQAGEVELARQAARHAAHDARRALEGCLARQRHRLAGQLSTSHPRLAEALTAAVTNGR